MPLLLPALLGLAGCVAKGFPEGKRAFIFAGPEGERERTGDRRLVEGKFFCGCLLPLLVSVEVLV